MDFKERNVLPTKQKKPMVTNSRLTIELNKATQLTLQCLFCVYLMLESDSPSQILHTLFVTFSKNNTTSSTHAYIYARRTQINCLDMFHFSTNKYTNLLSHSSRKKSWYGMVGKVGWFCFVCACLFFQLYMAFTSKFQTYGFISNNTNHV